MNPFDLYPHCWPADMPYLPLPIFDVADNGAGTIKFTIASTRYEMRNKDAAAFAQELLAAITVTGS